MRRHLVILCPLLLVLCPDVLRADAFDFYTNRVLVKATESKAVKELKQLTPDLIADHDHVLPGVTGSVLIVQTNEGRYAYYRFSYPGGDNVPYKINIQASPDDGAILSKFSFRVYGPHQGQVDGPGGHGPHYYYDQYGVLRVAYY